MTYLIVGCRNFACAPKKGRNTVAYFKLFHHMTFWISVLGNVLILGLDHSYPDWEYPGLLSVSQVNSKLAHYGGHGYCFNVHRCLLYYIIRC
jgi:hypothetical protein